MPISGKEMVKLYLAAGWIIHHIKGSHYRLEKAGEHETIPVHGNQDLGKGLEQKLLKRLKGKK
jgi:predicted RNA binding protein YcfA (HicA-like mRNA interferase family)